MRVQVKRCALLLFVLFCLVPGNISAELSQTRIASLNLCTDELLVRLAPVERIVGVTKYAHDPNTSSVSDRVEGVPSLQGESEEVLALNADVILAGVFSRKTTVNFLKRNGKHVSLLKVPTSFEDIYKNILIIGKVIGEEKKAVTLVQSMKKELLLHRWSPDKKKRVLFYNPGGMSPGKGTFEHAIIEEAGAINFTAEKGIVGHGKISIEELIVGMPDVVIFSGNLKKDFSLHQQLLNHPALKHSGLQSRILVIKAPILTCGSPASVEAVKLLSEKIYGSK